MYNTLSQQMSVLLKLFEKSKLTASTIEQKSNPALTHLPKSFPQQEYLKITDTFAKKSKYECKNLMSKLVEMQERKEQAAQLLHERQSPVACS